MSYARRYAGCKTYQRVLKIRQLTFVCRCVCPAFNSSRSCEWIFMKFDVGDSELLQTHTSFG